MSKYTSGPWFVVEYGGFFEIQDKDDYQGTIITDLEKCPDAEANAKLMAASPEMIEAMQEFVDRVDKGEVRSKKTYAKFKAIIKKATE